MIEPDEIHRVTSFDGTRIACQVFGQGSAIVVGNGIGVGYRGLALQIARLRQRFRVVSWDHRGIFRSAAPGSGGTGVRAHARDCLAVMDALGLAQAGYLGWSMGVQVGFEVARLQPGRLSRLAGIGGVAGDTFRAALPLPALPRLVPRALAAAVPLARLARPLVRRIIAADGFFRAACLSGYVRPHADREVFMTMARGVAEHDPALYLTTLAALGRHDATAVLPDLAVPVLFLAGAEDHMTPRRVLERLARMAPKGRVHVVAGASHFVTIEAPDEVGRVLEQFFSEPEGARK
ncbi:MAG: alpha/beta fold hydrolase [Deltaproteobacteria bacterium]|nr:alpha/beta fold hydrolase [Deltaproteobacteria bacterium]